MQLFKKLTEGLKKYSISYFRWPFLANTSVTPCITYVIDMMSPMSSMSPLSPLTGLPPFLRA